MVVTKKPDKSARLRKRVGHYHHGDLKEALVLTAEQLVARTGKVDLSLREIAAEAGVTHAAAYRHFQGKVELLSELACRGFRQLGTNVDAAARLRKGTEALVEAGMAYVAFANRCPGLFRVMFHPSLKPFVDHPDLDRAANAALEVLMRVVMGLESEPLPNDVLRIRAMTAWATIHGQAVLQLEQQLNGPFGVEPAGNDEAARLVFRTLVCGLKPEPPRPNVALEALKR